MVRFIMLPVIAVCVMRTANYGIYTARSKNYAGAVSLFLMASAAAMASVYFFLR